MAPLTKTREVIKKLPASKPHLEFIAAILTIPVLITVLLLNLANINSSKKATLTPIPSAQNNIPVHTVERVTSPNPTANPTSCIKGIGPIDISYPQEGQVVSDSPLCIGITYTQGDYCA